MKKIFFILFVVLTISNNSNSQTDFSQDVHKYLVYQAVKLLQVKYPEVINSNPEFFYWLSGGNPNNNWEDYSSNAFNYNIYDPYSIGSLYTGAEAEDHDDIIDQLCGNYVTLSHFWHADAGDGANPPLYELSPTENAYKKILKLWFGNYNEGIVVGYYRPNNYPITMKIIFGEYNNYGDLAEAYNQIRLGNLDYLRITGFRMGGIDPCNENFSPYYMSLKTFLLNNGMTLSEIEKKQKIIIFETLGRICHLLGDMGVPAHAHNSTHIYGDRYETDWVSNNYNNPAYKIEYYHNNVINKGIVNINALQNPIRGLTYYINQVADRLPSQTRNPEPIGDEFIHGDLIWNNYLPSIHPDNSFLHRNINDYYNYIQYYIFCWDEVTPETSRRIHETTFPILIRGIAGFIDYFIKRTTYTIPEPVFKNIYQTPYYIPLLSEGHIFCNLINGQNPNDYIWTWQAIQTPPNNGKLFDGYYNYCKINFVSPWNSKEVPLINNLLLKVTVQKKGSSNYIQTTFRPNFIPPGNTGCPWVFVQSQDSNIVPENNILHKSLLPSNYGVEIKDKYIIKNQPLILNNKIFLNIVETNNDSSIINRVKLYAIDHHVSKKIAITEDNTIVTYDSSSVIDNIYSTLFDPEYNFTEITDNILFHKEQRNNVIGDSLYNLYSEFKYNSGQNPSIIVNVKRNPSYPVNKDSYTGIIIGHTPNGSFQNQFIRRENPDNFIFPIGTKNIYGSVDSAHISWDKSFDIRYLAVASVSYSGYTLTELPLSLAYHTLDGDITNNLNYVDSLTSYISENHYLNLEFQNIDNNTSDENIREYILEVDGKVLQAGSQRMSLMNKVKENNQIPEIFSLSQNYPNPFNPVTNIKYQIPINTFVTVKVYDILGKEVKTLVNEFKSVGNYSVLFDASSLASGIYFYKMSAGEFSDVKRMVLVK